MSERARRDPKDAVGGLWEEMGRLQLGYLERHGLKPAHALLDIGCGSLRGGLHFVAYLEPGHYCGMDISPDILAAGRRFLLEAGLADRGAELLVNGDLRFSELSGRTFDFLLAQFVFSHVPIPDVDECFTHVHRVMHAGSVFFATVLPGGPPSYQSPDRLDWSTHSRRSLRSRARAGSPSRSWTTTRTRAASECCA